jgi:hypothetical protein
MMKKSRLTFDDFEPIPSEYLFTTKKKNEKYPIIFLKIHSRSYKIFRESSTVLHQIMLTPINDHLFIYI